LVCAAYAAVLATVASVHIERDALGDIPCASIGSGPPLVLLAGLYPVTGVAGDGFVRSALAPVRQLAKQRRIIVLNRWSGLPPDLTMQQLAARHADAIRTSLDGPVDVVGISTGGSIAQQLAADHPDTIRRLALISTACRLGPVGRESQARVATLLRAGATRRAVSVAAASIAPAGLRTLARAIGWAAARPMISTPAVAADLIATLDAEDAFDLAGCANPIQSLTLIISGARDRFYTPALMDETARLIPRSRLEILPHRGHLNVAGDHRATATLAGFLTG
jgi:pimeloyl-ACP methyl ester carboxylesterase